MNLGPRCGISGREAAGVPGLLTLTPHDGVPVRRIERRARELVIEDELTSRIPPGRRQACGAAGADGQHGGHRGCHQNHGQTRNDETPSPYPPAETWRLGGGGQ